MMPMLKTIVSNSNYAVSRDGNVWSRFARNGKPLRTGELRRLSPGKTSSGYLSVCIQGKSCLVHRLVCEAFVSPLSEGQQVNHIDGNKLNNDASNLEAVSAHENIQHAVETGLINQKGTRNSNSKLSDDAVAMVRELSNEGVTAKSIAASIENTYGVSVSPGYVNQLLRGLYR